MTTKSLTVAAEGEARREVASNLVTAEENRHLLADDLGRHVTQAGWFEHEFHPEHSSLSHRRR